MPVRPLAYDNSPTEGSPVVAAWQAFSDIDTPRCVPVTHSYAVLAFYTGGRARLEQNGRWELAQGDVLLVPPGQPHRFLRRQRPAFWGLSFSLSSLAAGGAASLLDPFERVRDGAAAVSQVPASRHAFLEGLFRELEAANREPSAQPETRAAVQNSLLTLILNEVARATATHSTGAAPTSGVVAASLRFIERNCLRRLTLTDVAAAVGRSPAYVTSALSRATGRSAVEWIVSCRMAEARRLLLHSEEMIDVIAERVGYADPTHFIRMFRRAHGATPAAWRALAASGRQLPRMPAALNAAHGRSAPAP